MTLMLLLSCARTPAPEPEPAVVVQTPPHAGLDFADPGACASCHEAIHAEWEQSMHARAHADRDPLFAAMRTLRVARQGEAVGRKCATCHNPLAPDAPDSPAGRVGVGCGACHEGPDATLAAPDARTLCLRCHDATRNPQGVATCTTGPENEHAGGATCVACHMRPSASGHLAHRFDGPHRAWLQDDPAFLREAVGWSMTREGDVLHGTLVNRTGHAFPSGFPGRVAVIELTDGTWSTEAAVLRKVYVDEAGNPTLPPFAARLAEDTRLEPGASRAVTLTLPPGTGDITVRLRFHLVPPPAVKTLGVDGLPEASPVIVQLN